MNLLKFTCVALVVLLNGCYHEDSFESEVIIRPGTKGFNYELQIKVHSEARGNPHNPFDWKVHNWDHSYWLYVNTIEGTISAGDLVLTPYWRCLEYPWNYRDVKGGIELQHGRITIKLDMPRYEVNTLIGHAPLEANGTYTIRVIEEPWKPPTEEEARTLEAAPCKR